METVPVRGGHVVVDDVGGPGRPVALLVAGTGCSMDLWRPDLVAALVAAGLRVVRFDQRDTGMASADPAGAPTYGLPDLVDDALAVLDALGVGAAHWVGFSQGGWVAQLAAVHHPERVLSLGLVATRPVAHGPNAPDLPEVSDALMATFSEPAPPSPEPGDVEAWIDHLVAGERPFASATVPFDEVDVRALAAVVVERTRDLDAMLVNHTVAPQGDGWRHLLPTVSVPTTVVHGEDDPLFPVGNGVALAAEIPHATLHRVAGMGHELPARVRPTVAALVVETVRRSEATAAPIDALAAVHLGGDHLVTMADTEVRPSEVHGRGLFATAGRAAGTLLGTLDGQVVDPDVAPDALDALEWNALSPTALLVRPLRTSYGFMNHSADPNVAVDPDGRGLRASRTIEVGDELTVDYLAQPVPPAYLSSPEVARLGGASGHR